MSAPRGARRTLGAVCERVSREQNVKLWWFLHMLTLTNTAVPFPLFLRVHLVRHVLPSPSFLVLFHLLIYVTSLG